MDDPASYFLASLIDSAQHSNTLLKILAKLCAVLLFVGANAFFVGAEFALVSVRRPRLEARAAAGSRRAQAAMRLLADPTSFISATQLGITIASLALGWIGEPTIASMLDPIASRIASAGRAGYIAHILAIIIAFAAITFLHIVLGELMPKMFALERAEGLALFAARPLEIFAKVFQWPLWIFNRTGATLGRLLGLKSSLQHAAVYSEAELRQLVDISRESGHLRAEERRLIPRVFEFSDTLVREAMVPRPAIAAISADCSLEQITQAFQQHRYSRLPVYQGSLDNVVGFIHSKDLIPYLLRPQDFRLVGDISDEHDEEVNEQISLIDDRTYLLDGSLAVRDLNRRLKTSVPESETYTTIGGFLMTVAGHVLQPDEVIEHDGLRFHIEKVERRRLLRVRLELPEKKVTQTSETAMDAANAGH